MRRNQLGPRFVRKASLLLAAVLVTGLVGACSNAQQQPAPSPSAELPMSSRVEFAPFNPAQAWSERLCRALLPAARAASPPSLDINDLKGSRQRVQTYLHDHVAVLNAALTDIAAAGPAPVDNGPRSLTSPVTARSAPRAPPRRLVA
jgi:hypothetical protein